MFKVRIRILIGFMMAMACFTAYGIRTNISIILVAMVENTNASAEEPPDYGPRFKWSELTQAHILGGFYYGYVISTLLGGTLAEQCGGTNVIGIAIFVAGVLTMLHPVFAGPYSQPTFVLRILIGLAVGVVYPACHNIVANWAPPFEKGKFLAGVMSGPLGAVVTMLVTSVIIKHIEWRVAFYLEGLFAILVSITWFILVRDTPNEHRCIKLEEKDYINENLDTNLALVKKIPPYLQMLKSIPYLALVLLHFGNIWGLTFVLNYAPKYMHQVLQYDITVTGFLAGLPSLMRFIATFVFGSIADIITYKEIISVKKARKCLCVPSHIIPGLLLIALGLWATEPWLAVLLLTLSLGFNGAAVASNIINPHDLAPNYVGTLVGVMNFFGNLSGFIGPIVVSALTEHHNTREQWSYVFYVGAGMYIVPAILYFFLGKVEIQPWNFQEDGTTQAGNVNEPRQPTNS